MPKTNTAKAKKSAKKPVKKAAKASVKKIAKATKPIAKKVIAKKSAAKKTVTKKPVAKKSNVVVSKTKSTKPQTAVKAKVTKSPAATKTVAKSVKAKVSTSKTPAKSAQPVSPKLTPAVAKTHRRAASGGPSGFVPYQERHDEEYMGEKQLTHFQHILHLWKDQIHADRNIVAKQIRDDSVNFPDPLDRAVVEEEHTLEWRAREREHRLIEKIDQALSSIKQGDYGFCEACGAEIGVRRLEARPTATLCIDCKTIDEIRERQNGVTE